MTYKAKAFAGMMIAAGAVALTPVWFHPVWTEPLHFATYLGLILLASGMKVVIPQTDGNGTMSVNFIFILLALMQLTPAEAMVAGCVSVLVQCLYRVKKGFKPIQIAFNLANIAVAIVLACIAYRELFRVHATLGVALAVASTVYFLANTFPVATMLGLEQATPVLKLWYRTFNWYFPFYLFGAAVVACIQYVTVHYGWPTSLLVFPVAWAVYVSYRNYLGRLQDQKSHIEQMADLHMRTIEALALAIEAKDQNTHDHLCRVRVYACELGRELQLDAQEMEALRAAALLHDIGKLAVPEHIINKPGKLTPEEFEKMKIHPVVGAEILQRVNFPYPVVPIVRSHHERWDGKGYPDGLAGEQIPIGARILTAVDCLDALATDRPYRRALSLDEAMAHVAQLAGTQFDPRVVEVLNRRCKELEAMARKEGATIQPLHLDVQVRRGEQPGAGFERSASAESLGKAGFVARHAAWNTPLLNDGESLEELTKILSTSLSLDETLTRFCDALHQRVAFDTLAVYIRKGDTLQAKFTHGTESALFSSLRIPLGEGLAGWVAQNRRPIVNGNPSVEPGYLNDPTKFSLLRSAVAVPLENPHGEILGVLVLYARPADAFHDQHLSLLQALSSKVALAIESAVRYYLAQSQASIDFLTRALNTGAFTNRLESELKRCVTAGQPLTLILCDLDAFGEVNETFGYVEGNRFLSRLADRLRDTIREGDCLGRLGGDEFALLLPGLDRQTAEARARDLRAAVRDTSIDIFGGMLTITASLGIASFPEEGDSLDQLLECADRDLSRAKRTRDVRVHRDLVIATVAAKG